MNTSKQQIQQPISGPVAARFGSVRNPAFRDIYSNNNRLAVSPFDFSVTFGRIVEPTMGVNVVEDEVVVQCLFSNLSF